MACIWSWSLAPPAFHAMTGCDTVSAYIGKGKKTAYRIWQTFPDVTFPLQLLASLCPTIQSIEENILAIEMFVVKLYGVQEECVKSIDETHFHLLLHKGKNFDNSPPSSDANKQHILRTAYQTGLIWGNSLIKRIPEVSPTEWGWCQTSPKAPLIPRYTTKPTINRHLPELVTCGCKKDCKSPCACCVKDYVYNHKAVYKGQSTYTTKKC